MLMKKFIGTKNLINPKIKNRKRIECIYNVTII